MTGDGKKLATDPAGGVGSAAELPISADTAAVRTEPAVESLGDLPDRILAASLKLITRWGMGKTTLADVAQEAGCSRATLYRVFPGGKQELFLALGRAELDRYFAALVDLVDRADNAEDALTNVLVEATRRLETHDALQYVLEREPDIVLPFLGFHQVDRLYAAAADTLGPSLERLLPEQARWVTEWLGRTVLSYAFDPSPTIDLQRPADARKLVRRFILPALQPLPALAVHA